MKVSGTLPQELFDWIQKGIQTRRFHNMSYALEVSVLMLKKIEENGKKLKD